MKNKETPVENVQKEQIVSVATKKVVKHKQNPLVFLIAFSCIFGIGIYLYTKSIPFGLLGVVGAFAVIVVYIYFKKKLDEAAKIRKMEEVFPDFIELMASNLRAGMTIDRALLVSSRKEFSPLDVEILKLGKDILTGKEITSALKEMADRINSEKIRKTIELINSGMKAGGNLSILLEETAVNMREKMFIEKKASSNVLMYVIFIFFASSVGAPTLFALSTVLVQIMTKILGNIPADITENSSKLPFSFTSISISPEFITIYAFVFIIVTNILASLMLGITNKGEEKEGLKYVPAMIVLSIIIFIALRALMSGYFNSSIG